jgi:hypothetical protein
VTEPPPDALLVVLLPAAGVDDEEPPPSLLPQAETPTATVPSRHPTITFARERKCTFLLFGITTYGHHKQMHSDSVKEFCPDLMDRLSL